jgi:putative ABC transport system permease protein
MIRHLFKLIWNRKRTNVLMMTEIFVSFLVLFAVLSLAVYMFDNWRRPIGFSTERIWNVGVDMKQASDDSFDASQQESTRQLFLALREFPEIEATAATMLAPYQFGSSNSSYRWQNRTVEFGVAEVTDGFRDLLGLKIVEGRWFGPEDEGQAYDPVVINRAMRVDLFGQQPAIGKDLASDDRPTGVAPTDRPRRVVGVVEEYREDGEFDGTRDYAIFRKSLSGDNQLNRPPRNLLIKVRAGASPDFEERLTKRLQAAAPGWSFDVVRLSQMRDDFIRFAIAPLIGVSLVAAFLMLMVALGLFGVLWQAVTQRTRELGLRRAKGAAKVNVRRQILGEIAVMTFLSMVAGTLVVAQFPLLNVIYFVEPHVYVLAFMLSVATIFALTLLCGWYPSHVATRLEPAEALRYE